MRVVSSTGQACEWSVREISGVGGEALHQNECIMSGLTFEEACELAERKFTYEADVDSVAPKVVYPSYNRGAEFEQASEPR